MIRFKIGRWIAMVVSAAGALAVLLQVCAVCQAALAGSASDISTAQTAAAGPTDYQSLDRASVAAQAAISACRKKRLDGELKTRLDSVNCSNPEIVAAYRKSNYRYMDLVGQMTDERVELAGEIDRLNMSEGQSETIWAQFMVHLVDIERQRDRAGK